MYCTLAPCRKGINVIQALIILFIVLVAIGLALVGIRNWWDRANQAYCMNNLKLLGKSMVNYQDTNKQLPASTIAKKYGTWAVQLAPFLPQEMGEPLKKWDLANTYYQQPEEIRQTQVHLFYCPARRSPPQLSKSGDVPSDGLPVKMHYPGALGDYACSSGDGSSDWTDTEANGAIIPALVVKKENGKILEWKSQTSLNTLPSGQSTTILIGDKYVPLGEFGLVSSGDGSLYNGDYSGNFARVGGQGFGLAQSITEKFNNQFGSFHPGICQFLMADGSVQSFSTSMSEEVLGKLTNRKN